MWWVHKFSLWEETEQLLQCLIALLYLFSVLLNISIFYTLSLQQQFDKANAYQDVELKLKLYNRCFPRRGFSDIA